MKTETVSKTGDRKAFTKKAIALTVLTLFLASTAASATLKQPLIEGNSTVGSEINFTVGVENQSSLDDPDLFIKKPLQEWREMNLTYSSGLLYRNVSETFFDRKGLYRYYFKVDGTRFPYMAGLPISSGNKTVYNAAKNFTLTDYSSYSYCDNEACGYENWQAWVFLSQVKAFRYTGNAAYRDAALNFSLSNYQDEPVSTCAPEDGDFDCGYVDVEYDFYGGTRQGSLIHSLWQTYKITENQTVKERALNYTKGSADDCDVWNQSFRCATPRSQASMILGYWTAYQSTGNQTYKLKAENLSLTNYSTPRIAEGLLQGYKLTGNSTYKEKAENITREWLEKCPNCSETRMKDLKKALWKGYKVTGDYGYYGNALLSLTSNSTNSTCSGFNEYSCGTSQVQALSSLSMWKAFNGKKDVPASISSPEIRQRTVSGNNLTIEPELDGRLQNLTLKLNSSNTLSCDVDFFEGCTLPEQEVYNQTVYRYWFESEKLRFPSANGSFRFATSLVNQKLLEKGLNFTETNPESNSYCKPWNGEYRCKEEAYQGFMIQSFSTALEREGSPVYKSKLLNLSSPPYYESGSLGIEDYSCLPSQGNFNCSNTGVVNDLNGSNRQGRLIKSLWGSYQLTGNETFYRMALNYTTDSAEDCDVWNQSFQCGSERGQSAMINGYWKAYKETGNQTYRSIAVNLSREAVKMNDSAALTASLWKTYSYTGNSTYRTYAAGATSNLSGRCSSGCAPEEYGFQGLMMHNSYLYGGASYLTGYKDFLSDASITGSCSLGGDESCETPRQQALISDLYVKAGYTVPVDLKVDTAVQTPDQAEVGNSFSVKCSMENVMRNSTLYDVRISPEGSSSDVSVSGADLTKDNMSYGEKVSKEWSFTASSAGSYKVGCGFSSESGLSREVLKTVDVRSGESSSSFTPSFDFEESEPLNKTIIYNLTESRKPSTEYIEMLGFNTETKNYTALTTCTDARRRILDNRSWIEVFYRCEKPVDFLVIDTASDNSSIEGEKTKISYINNFANGSIKLSYQGNMSEEGWAPPYVLSQRLKPLKADYNFSINKTARVLNISANLSREVKCKVNLTGEKALKFNSSGFEKSFSLDYGNTTAEIACGGEKASKNFRVERPDTELSVMPFIAFAAGFLSLTLLLMVVYRYKDGILGFISMQVFKLRFYRFKKAVNSGEAGKAIEVFDSMSKDVSGRIINSDIDLMRGLLLYLLMDMLENGEEDRIGVDVGEELKELVPSYIQEAEDEKAREMVKQKYSRLDID
ncbi:MAG: hypothetical protein ABEJ93_01500 [Candidatus Nanohalobium sp.]